ALEEQGERPRARAWVVLAEPEDRVPAARRCVLRAGRIGVARLVEEELPESGAGAELPILGSLERRAACRLGQRVCVEWGVSVRGGGVDRLPLGPEALVVGVQRELIGTVERCLAVERDRGTGVAEDLENLQLAVVEIARVLGDVAKHEAVGTLRRGPGLKCSA